MLISVSETASYPPKLIFPFSMLTDVLEFVDVRIKTTFASLSCNQVRPQTLICVVRSLKEVFTHLNISPQPSPIQLFVICRGRSHLEPCEWGQYFRNNGVLRKEPVLWTDVYSNRSWHYLGRCGLEHTFPIRQCEAVEGLLSGRMK